MNATVCTHEAFRHPIPPTAGSIGPNGTHCDKDRRREVGQHRHFANPVRVPRRRAAKSTFSEDKKRIDVRDHVVGETSVLPDLDP